MRYTTGILLKSFCFILCYVFIAGGQSDAFAGETVRINGSGTGLAVMKPLIEAYSKTHPGVTFEMQKPLGSSGAIKALLAGTLDIVVSSRPLKADEAAKGAKHSTFGKTPLAIITNRSVSRKNILTGELEDIYSGITRKWPNGQNIRVVLRPKEDTDTKILRGLSPGMDKAVTEAQRRQGMLMAVTDPESNEMVLKTGGSLGAAGLAGILAEKIPVNVLSLNDVMPTPRALAEGRYALSKDIDFVTTGALPEAAAAFLDFVYSAKGRALVERLGVLVTGSRIAYR